MQEPRKAVEDTLKSKARDSSTEVAALEKKMKVSPLPLSCRTAGQPDPSNALTVPGERDGDRSRVSRALRILDFIAEADLDPSQLPPRRPQECSIVDCTFPVSSLFPLVPCNPFDTSPSLCCDANLSIGVYCPPALRIYPSTIPLLLPRQCIPRHVVQCCPCLTLRKSLQRFTRQF